MQLKQLLIFIILVSLFTNCKTAKRSHKTSSIELDHRIQQFISCHNTQDLNCLLELYHKDYQSLSPVNQPASIRHFINETLNNLKKNNFEIAIQIKEIEQDESLAYVSMNWQLKTKGAPKEDDPFANVQRLDIWKKKGTGNWRLFRTVIYNERAF